MGLIGEVRHGSMEVLAVGKRFEPAEVCTVEGVSKYVLLHFQNVYFPARLGVDGDVAFTPEIGRTERYCRFRWGEGGEDDELDYYTEVDVACAWLADMEKYW